MSSRVISLWQWFESVQTSQIWCWYKLGYHSIRVLVRVKCPILTPVISCFLILQHVPGLIAHCHHLTEEPPEEFIDLVFSKVSWCHCSRKRKWIHCFTIPRPRAAAFDFFSQFTCFNCWHVSHKKLNYSLQDHLCKGSIILIMTTLPLNLVILSSSSQLLTLHHSLRVQ